MYKPIVSYITCRHIYATNKGSERGCVFSHNVNNDTNCVGTEEIIPMPTVSQYNAALFSTSCLV